MLHDKDIREPLFEFLEQNYQKVRILEEIRTGRSRADIVMVTDSLLWGIEIKSDADTYARLKSQVKDYDRYYDRNLLVVGSSHGLKAREHVPEWWGVLTVEETDAGLDFYVLRQAADNPKVTMEKKLSFLWRPELARLQEKYGMAKYKEKNKDFVVKKICERIPEKLAPEVLQRDLCSLLFERDYTTIAEELTEYRKGEIQKKIDAETDAHVRMALYMEQAEKRRQMKSLHVGRKRKRRLQ